MLEDMKVIDHNPTGICCKYIRVELTPDNLIHNVIFVGGCPGNHEAIKRLIIGRPADEVASLLRGTPCGDRPTSCGDQLAQALNTLFCLRT